MIKGGYKIVNFNGTALSGTAVDMPGIYDQIVDDYNKTIMVSGVILSGELQDDAYASVKVNDGSVDLIVYGGVITVTDDDEISFAAAKSPIELAAEIGDLDDLETTEKGSVVDAINELVDIRETVTLTAFDNVTIRNVFAYKTKRNLYIYCRFKVVTSLSGDANVLAIPNNVHILTIPTQTFVISPLVYVSGNNVKLLEPATADSNIAFSAVLPLE